MHDRFTFCTEVKYGCEICSQDGVVGSNHIAVGMVGLRPIQV